MRSFVSLVIVTAMLLSGCSYLPRFGGNNPNATPDGTGAQNPLIPEKENLISFRKKERPYTGTLIDQITGAKVEPVSGGKMVLVQALPLRQGAFDVRLVNDNEKGEPVNGVMTYTLRAYQPSDLPQGLPNSRAVDTGVFISHKDLAGVSSIRIVAERNQQILKP